MITCLCVTYGRVRFLERALGDFIAQDKPGSCELLIVNTFPKQKLQTAFTSVRIINLDDRPRSLGEARNMGVMAAMGDRVIIWDDDDRYLPHHIRTFQDNWRDGMDWLWMDKRFCALGDELKEISYGCHGGCFGFTKRAWRAVGGYPPMTVGEDRVLVQNITKLNGSRLHFNDAMPSFVCCWGNGAYHLSGEGDDKPGCPTAHERAQAALVRRVGNGEERTGTIQLHPSRDGDWPSKAQAFMAADLKKKSVNRDVCVVELGRYGDIVNILPILLHIHNEYGTPSLMVSRQFADLLDGVSYVTPFITDLRNDQLEGALKVARKQFQHVICAQIWGGPTWCQERLCESFNMESWRMCGFERKFFDTTWRPVFDRRDPEREALLVQKVDDGRPMILANLTHSVSSPFPEGESLLNFLTENLHRHYNVVNIGGLKLHRIYDLLGLMDVARCLVSVDSAHLHLAAASKCPVVALTNNEPWLATIPRTRQFHKVSYRAALQNTSMFLQYVRQYANSVTLADSRMVLPLPMPPQRRLIHCVESHKEARPTEQNRKGLAQKSWSALYEAGVVPCPLDESNYPRTSLDIGERRALPFLKDVLAPALSQANEDDIIFFTNDDNFLHPQLPELLRYHIAVYECASAQRCEFMGSPMPAANRPPNEFTRHSRPHMGRDLFAFTARWLSEHWEQIPDFVLGCSDWDLCLACIIREQFGIKSTRRNLEEIIFPAELPLGYVSHRYHSPQWNKPGYVNSAPGQMHNRMLFRDWAAEHAPQLKFDNNLCI